MCLREQSHIYALFLQLFTELIALPPNAICIEVYDLEGPMNSSDHFDSLSLSDGNYFAFFRHSPIELCHNLLYNCCNLEHVAQG
jgi:hypothetical protein